MSNSEILKVRCVLEQMVIRDLFFEDGMEFVSGVAIEPAMLFDAMNEVVGMFDAKNPYDPSQFKVDLMELPDAEGACVTFPEPEEGPACYRAYMLCDKKNEKAAYITVERDKEGGDPILSRWDRRGDYYRYGKCPLEEEALVRKVLELFRAMDETE